MPIDVPVVVPGELLTATMWNTMRGDLIELDGKFTSWASYTPVLSGTGWSLGTTGSETVGAYCVTNGVVHFWARLTFGTTGATFGVSAAAQVSLPFAVEAIQLAYNPTSSVFATYHDASTGRGFTGFGELAAGPIVSLRSTYAANAAANGYPVVVACNSSEPFIWAASDVIRVSGWYRKA